MTQESQYPAPVLDAQPVLAETAPAPAQAQGTRLTLETVEGCMALQRMGELFAGSTIVPPAYQRNVSNCIVALDIASRMGLSPMTVFQNMHVIQGKPSWSSAFILASFNRFATDFGPMGFEFFGKPGTDGRGCFAYAYLKDSGKRVDGPAVTLGMAKEEKWGAKWRTMPELMLRYRAAAFFVRTTCPEILFGLYSQEEQEDIFAAENRQHTRPQAPTQAHPGPQVQTPAPAPQQAPAYAPLEKVRQLVAAFEQFRVTHDALVDYLGHDLDHVTMEELQGLRAIWSKLKKDEASPAEFFPTMQSKEAAIDAA